MSEDEIKRAINHFRYMASPTNSGHLSGEVTVKDINKLIKATAELFETLARSQNY